MNAHRLLFAAVAVVVLCSSAGSASAAPTELRVAAHLAPPALAPEGTRPSLAQSTVLGWGDEGPEVHAVQEQLRDLRFWVGPADGIFGWLTEQAVYAFQKANGITVDGLVGPETRAALADPVMPAPHSEQGQVVEVDKPRQLLYTVVDGQLEWVFHTSTGTEEPYQHPAGYTAWADTPPGSHSVYWEVDRWQDGVLGPLYRPKYFHEDGIAVHGYDHVPPYPVSHGCVRVTFAAMDYIWANDLMPLGTTVLVY
jgi:lipoprotein-anchoring transpeptidase ErfK/SrfK